MCDEINLFEDGSKSEEGFFFFEKNRIMSKV
jgi:hypothetical protein